MTGTMCKTLLRTLIEASGGDANTARGSMVMSMVLNIL
jgi:hypothetical protein